MNASSDQPSQPNKAWWRPVAFLAIAAALVLLLADLDTDGSDTPLAVDDQVTTPTSTPGNQSSGGATNDRSPGTTENPARLDSGWYWSVSYEDGPSSLWISSPKSERRIGQTVDEASRGIQLNDLAISPSGDLYAISGSDLYQLDAADQLGDTVPMQKVGPLVGVDSPNALTFLRNGQLIAAGKTGISEIDIETGTATALLTFTASYQSSGDLIQVADETLLLTVSSGPNSDALAEVRLDTGEFRILIEGLPAATYGLVGSVDELFGLHVATENEADCRAGGVLIAIDIASASTSTIRCLDFTPGGSAHSEPLRS